MIRIVMIPPNLSSCDTIRFQWQRVALVNITWCATARCDTIRFDFWFIRHRLRAWWYSWIVWFDFDSRDLILICFNTIRYSFYSWDNDSVSDIDSCLTLSLNELRYNRTGLLHEFVSGHSRMLMTSRRVVLHRLRLRADYFHTPAVDHRLILSNAPPITIKFLTVINNGRKYKIREEKHKEKYF